MSNLPVIAGTYYDLRQVKSRGCWQIVIDVPATEAEKLVEAFGLPSQGEPTWLAVARLKSSPGDVIPTPASSQGDAGDASLPPPSRDAPGGAKTYTLANRVGMTCAEPKFWRWIAEKDEANRDDVDAVFAAKWVRLKCGVKSRADILPGTPAATKWHALALEYEQATGRLAEERP